MAFFFLRARFWVRHCRTWNLSARSWYTVFMKWPTSVAIIRHGESAYNVLKQIKKDGSSAFGAFEDRFWKEYKTACDEHWVSEELRTLAAAARGELADTFSQGDYLTPLTDEGIRQARETGARLMRHVSAPDVIYVSPYVRTRHTLECILETCPALRNAPVIYEERIREQEHGLATIYNDWRLYLVYNPEQAILYKRGGIYEYRFLNGENKADVRDRVRDFLATLVREHAGERVLMISHHLTLLAFRANLERWDREEFMRVDSRETPINCGVTIYRGDPAEGKDGRLMLETYNSKIY